MLTAIVGINWGDEGKGRMVDLLSRDYDVIIRYQGGNNAGHTVINERGKFILNLLPSGILRPGAVNVMGNGMVIDLEHLVHEIQALRDKGVRVSPENLKISDRATICMPYHRELDCLEEDRLGDAKYGSTRRGIAPVYGDKYMKKALRMGDLLEQDTLRRKVEGCLEWKNLTIAGGYGARPVSLDETMSWLQTYGGLLAEYVCDVSAYLDLAAAEGRDLMFEAQLGALRDIDFGIYPYTSSSSTIAAYAPIGAGLPGRGLDKVIGVIKAYSSCVGEGPFVCEMRGPEADALREAGGEYGAATGRPRRVGGFDVPASAYGCRVQGATELALTKLDVLSYMERIPVCFAYEIDGVKTGQFVTGDRLARAKPLYEYLDGFGADVSGCRSASELPSKAMDYIKYIEGAVGCPVRYVSVGPSRNDYIQLY